MKLTNSGSQLSQAESDFKDFLQRGDDFYKIELLRQANIWYKKALSLNIENEKVRSRISECDRLLAFESKVVKIIMSIVSAFVLLYLLIDYFN